MRPSNSIERPENPRKGANFLSALTFWYALKTFKIGRKRDIDESDLPKVLDAHKSSVVGEKLAINWSDELQNAYKQKRQPSLAKVIIRTYISNMIFYAIVLFFMEIIVRCTQPIFIGLFIKYFTEENRKNNKPAASPMWMNRVFYYWSLKQSPITKEEAYFYAGWIMICSIIVIGIYHPYILAAQHVGMQIRVACCSLIYRKALRLHLTSLGGSTVGHAVNLMSNDVIRFDYAPLFLHYLWLSPLQAGLITFYIFLEVGMPSVNGMLVAAFVVPFQIFLGVRTAVLRTRSAGRTDSRVRQMNEIIKSIQVIKMYAWEPAFGSLISDLRKKELRVLLQTSFIRGLTMSFIMFTARSAIFLTVCTYVLIGNQITAQSVFLIGAYYQILRTTLTVYFPQGINSIAETAVAIKRIQNFLMIEEAPIGDPAILDPKYDMRPRKSYFSMLRIIDERHKKSVRTLDEKKQSRHSVYGSSLQDGEEAEVTIIHGIAKYGDNLCLDNINLHAKPGELIAIVGPVGAGKSCLLNLILGELKLFSGKLYVKGTVAYASQEPWLFEESVRQNILFGREYDSSRYKDVVRVCALQRDFSLLPFADRTIVGERGISLSGGQRARVNLARAVYNEANIYLLDDPLSAVDIQVGQQLFEQCCMKYLGDKIVILVTHQLQYLKRADRIVILYEGAIQAQGTYAEIKSTNLSFASLLQEAATLATVSTAVVAEEKEGKELNKALKAMSAASMLFNSMIDIEGVKGGPKVAPEMRTAGSVGFYIYKEYFHAGGNYCVIALLGLFFLGAQGVASGGDWFLSYWVALEVSGEIGAGRMTTNMCIWIFTAIIIATIVVTITRSLFFYAICMRASLNLHDRMFEGIIHAAMSFFHANTSGRILNRFSKDLGAVDELLPNAFIDTVQLLLNLMGALVVVCIINPYLLIPVIMMCVTFHFLRKFYLKTSLSVKRLEGITRSPVFAHLNASLQGLPTIRSNNAEIILVEEFDNLQDIHSSAWFMFLYTARAFSLWLDWICVLFIGIVTFSFLIFSDGTCGSDVGLAITQCIGLTGLIQWGMRQSAELENQMTAVERVLEFTRVENEPDLFSEPEKKPPASWPKYGRIEFINTTMRYNVHERPVLKNLNIVIPPRHKVGIVGRTGAGKSSLIVTLFRLASFDGEVLIDHLDISVLGLHDLRKKISIIPQEPVLFSGTLRYNLDPFQQYNDKVLLSALIDVEDKEAIIKGEDVLDSMVTENGANLSVGQRQMICLARAILRNNKILVMDEATANVDAQTDRLIQKTIRTKFIHCTVLTIAHRLHTVMDSDRILVMDAGKAVEYDHPYLLLQKANGYFTELVKKTGSGTSANLRKMAKESYEARQANLKLSEYEPSRSPRAGGTNVNDRLSKISEEVYVEDEDKDRDENEDRDRTRDENEDRNKDSNRDEDDNT